MNKELKLCPFCGNEAFHYSNTDNILLESASKCNKEIHFVMCKECPALICGETKEIAVSRWNKRYDTRKETWECQGNIGG